jgi:hypothetical protein
MLKKIKSFIIELIWKELNKVGITKNIGYSVFYPFDTQKYYNIKQVDELEDKLKKEIEELKERNKTLVKHFGLEYFRKEIKETNGSEKQYTKQGFRKIKKVSKKKKEDYDEDDDY